MFTSYRFYISAAENLEIAVKKCFFIFRGRKRKNAVNQKELIKINNACTKVETNTEMSRILVFDIHSSI